ncbi:hypothetical protein AB0H36_38990 [Kribbella sp. NPDC050820]|uniref:hypothetical protein n=1 Tax=Kribbella sp. NPDC050820 TaxID=3155408 RepID=UPI0033F2DECF
MHTDTKSRWTQLAPGVPSWAPAAAHVIALCTIPSAVWRIGIIVRFPAGYDEGWIERSELNTLHGALYLLFLCVLSEALALLAFGLIQRWGDTYPDWLPTRFAGRPLPRLIAVIPAAASSLALTAIWTIGVPAAALTNAPSTPP